MCAGYCVASSGHSAKDATGAFTVTPAGAEGSLGYEVSQSPYRPANPADIFGWRFAHRGISYSAGTLFDRNLGPLLRGFRQVLDLLIDHFPNRLQELHARVRQVLAYGR
jgi:hypothetical protein